ncbi:MAG: twin-arginine translocase TatA/TatE family subunit, partial [Armatimonadota bacterium]
MLPIAIGTNEVIIIVGVIVLLFGIKRLPELGRSLAEGIHEFKKASKKAQEEPENEENKTNKA